MRTSALHARSLWPDGSAAPPRRESRAGEAGTQRSGLHSRAPAESGIVWDRESLRRFLSDPRRDVAGAIMPVRISDPEALQRLLDLLESLR
jgi:cytochrome c2